MGSQPLLCRMSGACLLLLLVLFTVTNTHSQELNADSEIVSQARPSMTEMKQRNDLMKVLMMNTALYALNNDEKGKPTNLEKKETAIVSDLQTLARLFGKNKSKYRRFTRRG